MCVAGTYIPEFCEQGTYFSGSDNTAEDCTACPANYYCPNWGMSYSDMTTNYPCPAGYVCILGAIHPSNRDDVTIRFCREGYECDFANGKVEELCAIGTYNNLVG